MCIVLILKEFGFFRNVLPFPCQWSLYWFQSLLKILIYTAERLWHLCLVSGFGSSLWEAAWFSQCKEEHQGSNSSQFKHNCDLLQLWSYLNSFGHLLLWYHCTNQSNHEVWECSSRPTLKFAGAKTTSSQTCKRANSVAKWSEPLHSLWWHKSTACALKQ